MNELWIKCYTAQYRINIALWKRIVAYFEIENINFMIEIGLKFVINNAGIKIQDGVLWPLLLTWFNFNPSMDM